MSSTVVTSSGQKVEVVDATLVAATLGAIGWDGLLKTFFLDDNAGVGATGDPILRNGAASDPVEVAFNNEAVPVAGTWIEVEWIANVSYDDNAGPDATVQIFPMVLKDPGLPGEEVYILDNASGTIVGLGLGERQTIGGIAMFEVPDDWDANLYVRLYYLCDCPDLHVIIGASDGGLSFASGYGCTTLRATQYIQIQQAGVNTLIEVP